MELVYKPSSVLTTAISWLQSAVVIHLRQMSPPVSSDPTRKKDGPSYIFPIWSCFRCGFPGQPVARLPVSSYLAISPLPGKTWRYIFCCTFAETGFTPSPAGNYPASCPAKLGLSSRIDLNMYIRATTRLTPDKYHIIHHQKKQISSLDFLLIKNNVILQNKKNIQARYLSGS